MEKQHLQNPNYHSQWMKVCGLLRNSLGDVHGVNEDENGDEYGDEENLHFLYDNFHHHHHLRYYYLDVVDGDDDDGYGDDCDCQK